jgi:hypothetical protein
MGSLDDATVYTDISEVGTAARPKTALFFPSSVTRKSTYNILLYLHGDSMPGVERWLAADKRFPFREIVEVGGKNLVLVIPSLSEKSRGGKLETDPDWYLDRVLEEIGKADGGPPATMSKLVIAAHSGGGLRMFEMTNGMKKYRKNLIECWGFDCLYQAVGAPIPYTINKGRIWPPNPHPLMNEIEYKWAKSMIPFRVHYLLKKFGGSTAIRSENLDNLNYDIPYCRALVFSTTKAHEQIPAAYMPERLKALTL